MITAIRHFSSISAGKTFFISPRAPLSCFFLLILSDETVFFVFVVFETTTSGSFVFFVFILRPKRGRMHFCAKSFVGSIMMKTFAFVFAGFLKKKENYFAHSLDLELLEGRGAGAGVVGAEWSQVELVLAAIPSVKST